jgi:hypothetical protein
MLSVVYFFIMISKTLQLNQSLIDSCFNFQVTKSNQSNFCEEIKHRFQLRSTSYIPSCLTCSIEYIDIEIKSNCSKNFECASLNFDNNSIFERFFTKHHHIIPSLFPTQFGFLPNPILRINITNYNITNITNMYINSTLNINSSRMVIIVIFHWHLKNQRPLTVEGDRFFLAFEQLTIYVRCGYGGRFIQYNIDTEYNDSLAIRNRCPKVQSTTQVTTNN